MNNSPWPCVNAAARSEMYGTSTIRSPFLPEPRWTPAALALKRIREQQFVMEELADLITVELGVHYAEVHVELCAKNSRYFALMVKKSKRSTGRVK
jgi:hypothetical protein